MSYKHYLGNNKPTFLGCNSNKFMLPFWNFQKIAIFFRAIKPTLAGFLKFPEISVTWFLYGFKCNAQE